MPNSVFEENTVTTQVLPRFLITIVSMQDSIRHAPTSMYLYILFHESNAFGAWSQK